MSNYKHAYGWSGHILVSEDNSCAYPDHGIVAVRAAIFSLIINHYDNLQLDERIHIERLGVTSSDTYWLAAGANFSEGFHHYGAIFEYAELRVEGQPLALDQDGEYLKAMMEIYGLALPPCRLMVGCSSEH